MFFRLQHRHFFQCKLCEVKLSLNKRTKIPSTEMITNVDDIDNRQMAKNAWKLVCVEMLS